MTDVLQITHGGDLNIVVAGGGEDRVIVRHLQRLTVHNNVLHQSQPPSSTPQPK